MMVYCIYLGICLHGSVYIIFNISILNYMKTVCKFFPVGVIFPGGLTPTGKRIFLMVLFRQGNHHRQGKIYFPDGKKSTGKTGTGRKKRFFYGVQTVRVNDIIACRFCTAKEFYFLVGNPFFLWFLRSEKRDFS